MSLTTKFKFMMTLSIQEGLKKDSRIFTITNLINLRLSSFHIGMIKFLQIKTNNPQNNRSKTPF